MDDDNHPSVKYPIRYAILTSLQLAALGLAVLVCINMLLDYHKPPVPVCPIPAETETTPQ